MKRFLEVNLDQVCPGTRDKKNSRNHATGRGRVIGRAVTVRFRVGTVVCR
jgi:hypothetical protein